ncbi:ATP/GTP nucleotide-binding protein [Trypanosoma grayi]|uniref:ATP/GTP nucleotide-binding protein n=1 Tax=Trypanosoma grayi TaxID=71804 RepID=UPI0004F4B2E7|nr:ATP/GTP nucleotide-binding protein [Trypanosoma grayi]KEG15191.1 ATP/GTP nucleotide-binding protein [Trypanosoma grayi]
MSSKYDRVKIKVHLGGEHYYILSRFLLSKMLTFCKLPTTAAARVSLALKKFFVDQEKLEITQAELETATFCTMAQYGYGEAHARLFPLMTRFYIERVPLVILIAGSGCCGKTAIAHSLSSKLNTHNVVSTDVLLDILTAIHNNFPTASTTGDGEFDFGRTWPQPDERALWLRETETEEEFICLWRAWAEALHPLVVEELQKALTEGKVLLVEGSLLNLALYREYLLPEFQRRHGAIVVAFHVTSDEASRQFTVERFVSARLAMLPSTHRNDDAVAVEWVMRRLKAIEAEQLQTLASRGGGMRLCRIDERWDGSFTPNPHDACSFNGELSVDSSACVSPGVGPPDSAAEEMLPVYLVTYSVETAARPQEVMQELLLERIRAELHQRHS